VSQNRLLTALAWIVVLLVAGPLGVSVFVLGFGFGDSPCILCWAQRTGMALLALTALCVVRYGPRPRYLGMAVLLGVLGMWMALRHSSLHLLRDIGQGFSAPILGAHTYVWSWAIYWFAMVAIGALLLLLKEETAATGIREPGRVGRAAMGLFVVVVAANAAQAFASTGVPPYIGQGDPLRFSFDPRRWVWSMEEWYAPPMSWRGSWGVSLPSLDTLDADPAHGPLADLPALAVRDTLRVGVPLAGALSGLAWDAHAGRFLVVTDRHEVVVLDSTLARAVSRVRLDPEFSIDLSSLVGAAFLGDDTLAVLGANKSYDILRLDQGADAALEWRHFLSTDGDVTELRRARLATVRARQMYVHSFAFDPGRQELITLTVPSGRHQRLVVSRFARGDLLLSSEFVPGLAVGLRMRSTERSLADYVVTGAAVADSLLYAVSAAYGTLLVLDLDARIVRAAYAVPGLERPTGLAARGDELYVAQADGRVVVIERPRPPYAPAAPARCTPPSVKDC